MMQANGVAPVYPVHPGEILGEELAARGLSGKEFAGMAGLQATHLSAIIHGTRNITQAVAEKLEKALDGISADFWLKLQKKYNTEKNRRTKGISQLVAGYNPVQQPSSAYALADPLQEYGDRSCVKVSIPVSDKPLFELIAARLNWQTL